MPFMNVSRSSIFSVRAPSRSEQFQLVSGTNHFVAFFPEFGFEIFPVVSVLGVVVLIIQHAHDIQHGKPPLGMLLIPNGPDFAVIEESNGYLVGAHFRLLLQLPVAAAVLVFVYKVNILRVSCQF